MTVIAAAKVPKLRYTLLLYFPPSITQEILLMSYSDVTIVCFINFVGKPLHMHRGTAIVHLPIHRHPCQIYQILQKFQTLSSFFRTPFHTCDTLPQVFRCTLILGTNLLTNFNMAQLSKLFTLT